MKVSAGLISGITGIHTEDTKCYSVQWTNNTLLQSLIWREVYFIIHYITQVQIHYLPL